MSERILQFGLSFSSTYTYLSTQRIEQLARPRGISIEWYPFILKKISSGSGNQSDARKLDYMWKDMQRRADRHGLVYNKPNLYPVDYSLTSHTGLIACKEGWGPEFIRLIFRWNFCDQKQVGVAGNLEAALRHLGRNPIDVIERAKSAAIVEAMDRQTNEARSKGIFGSPSFIVDDELFWGDDRLEEALDWCAVR